MERTSNILTVKQLAAYLNMASVTIYRLAARGELPGTKVGGQWRFHRQAIDEWLSRKPERKRGSILVVEHEGGAGETFRDNLGSSFYRVRLARSGKEAMDALSAESFQLAFIDLALPDTGGVQLLKLIRESYPSTRAVVITSHSSNQLLAEALDLGFFMVLRKPFTGEQIRSVVNELVGHSGSQA
jgi:excisionase family DNA binding protein